jgi:hypothetical protein
MRRMLPLDDVLALTTNAHVHETLPLLSSSFTMSADNAVWIAIRSEENPFQYLFMLPVVIMVATW